MDMQGYFTPKGMALSAKLLTGAALTISRVVAGSGQTQTTATALSGPCQTLAVNSPTRSGNTAVIPATLAAAGTSKSYTLTELGVYAKGPDEGEILYKVYKLSQPVNIVAGGSMVLQFYLEEPVSQDLEVAVTCSPAGLVTEAMFTPVQERVLRTAVPTRTVTVQAADLPAYISGLPRLLAENLRIYVSGMLADRLYIEDFYGGGTLSFYPESAGSAVFQKPVVMKRCMVPVLFSGVCFQEPAGLGNYEAMLSATYGGGVTVSNCEFSGLAEGRGSALEAGYGSVMYVNGLKASNHTAVAVAASGGLLAVSCNAAGDVHDNVRGAYAYYGGIILLVGSATPSTLGGSANVNSGGIIAGTDGKLL